MPVPNFAEQFEGFVFGVRVAQAVALELELTFLSWQGAVLVVASPHALAGETIGLPHIPSFGMPQLRGYYRAGALTPTFTERLTECAHRWYLKRHALVRRADEIREYLELGFSMEEIAAWVESEIGAQYAYREFDEMLSAVAGGGAR